MKTIRSEQRASGAYYTARSVADQMAKWVLERGADTVLEPSAGDGAFLQALLGVAALRGVTAPHITAVELSGQAIERARSEITSSRVGFVHSDFFLHDSTGYAAAIGNPPFVRLRHLPATERARALQSAQATLGHEMDPSGSIWMPFVLHAARRLRQGGRLAMVLPLDATYVRYARPFWRALAASFTSLRVVRVRERIFPDILQDVVLLFAENFGGSTESIQFEAYEGIASLVIGDHATQRNISVAAIVGGQRAFLAALLTPDLQVLLDRLDPELVPAGHITRFRIGYVAGDKTFFHPTKDIAAKYALRRRSLIPTIASARAVRRSGLFTSGISRSVQEYLFYPQIAGLTSGEAAYVESGEKAGVSAAYKCRVRDPWYIVPYVARPDVVMSVFSDRPIVAINDAATAVSNSFLCGTVLEGAPELFACRWYNSLTLLQCELNVHSLGGGVFVLVPREAGAVKLLKNVKPSKQVLRAIDSALRRGDINAAYEAGDSTVLGKQTGLSTSDISLIRDGVSTLRAWRNPPSRAAASLSEEVDEELSLLES